MHPKWFTDIAWSSPVPIEQLRLERKRLPETSGVYCFTSYSEVLDKNFGVLYVGKAKNLRTRVPSYLVDPEKLLLQSTRSKKSPFNTSLKHAGKVLMLMEVQAKYRQIGDARTYIWVRWTECASPHVLEAALLKYLSPKYCGQGVER